MTLPGTSTRYQGIPSNIYYYTILLSILHIYNIYIYQLIHGTLFLSFYKQIFIAGAYGIQERGGCFIKSIEGDFYTVMGLPLHTTCREIANVVLPHLL